MKIFPSHHSGTPVINIGNLSTGGTGKSPHTEFCIQLLNQKKLAVLSRGYKRKTKGYVLASKEESVKSIGDEPYVFHKKYKNIFVAVDEKRKRGIQNLVKDIQPEVIFLDDAYQHRSVTPDFQILLTDYNHPFYDDYVLPAGNLRENRFGAKRANIVVVTKTPDDIKPRQKHLIKEEIEAYTTAKVLFSHIKYNALTSIFNQTQIQHDFEHIIALTGIAKPNLFIKKVRELAPKVQHHKYSDHYHFTEQDIDLILQYFHKISNTKKAIITTEKDAIRLLEFEDKLKDIPIFYWPIEIFMNNSDKDYLKNELERVIAK